MTNRPLVSPMSFDPFLLWDDPSAVMALGPTTTGTATIVLRLDIAEIGSTNVVQFDSLLGVALSELE